MAVENFTTYVETDPGSDLTVTSTKIDAVSLDQVLVYNVYKDFGTDYFDALDVDVEMYINSSSQTNNTDSGIAFINSSSPASEHRGILPATGVHAMIYKYNTGYRTYLMRNAGATLDSYDLLSANTLYYFTMTRSAGSDTVNWYVYSNAARTTLIDTLTISGFGTVKWRYCYGLMHNSFNEANNDFTGYIQNMNLNIPEIADFFIHNGGEAPRIRGLKIRG